MSIRVAHSARHWSLAMGNNLGFPGFRENRAEESAPSFPAESRFPRLVRASFARSFTLYGILKLKSPCSSWTVILAKTGWLAGRPASSIMSISSRRQLWHIEIASQVARSAISRGTKEYRLLARSRGRFSHGARVERDKEKEGEREIIKACLWERS